MATSRLKGTESTARTRTSRACDQCRKVKGRCDRPESAQGDSPCSACVLTGNDCTYLEPNHKRGPPKGYMNALERRLHEAEALLGTIISSSDPRAISLVSDLVKDPLANSIITRVTNSNFGPVGRNNPLPARAPWNDTDYNSHRRDGSNASSEEQISNHTISSIDENGHLVFTAPSNTWQDYLNHRLSVKSSSKSKVLSKALTEDAASSPQPGPASPGSDTEPSSPI